MSAYWLFLVPSCFFTAVTQIFEALPTDKKEEVNGKYGVDGAYKSIQKTLEELHRDSTQKLGLMGC